MLRKSSVINLFLSVLIFFDIVHSATLLPSITVSGGESHTLVLTRNGWVWSCGYNGPGGDDYHGVLGLGENAGQIYYTLQRVHGPNDVNFLQNISAISAGWRHSLTLDDVNGTMKSWGDGTYGELGNGVFYGHLGEEPIYDGESTPVRVLAGQQYPNDPNSLLRGIVGISAGRSGQHSLVVDSNGFVFSWGRGIEGQLGNSQYTQNYSKPVRVLKGEMETDSNFLKNIISVSAGEQHSMALERIDPNYPNCKGRVYTWGDNAYGKLGINKSYGQEQRKTTPVKVYGINNDTNGLQNIVAISAGWDHCMALEKLDANDANCKGRVYTWGNNGQRSIYTSGGRLGNGQITGSNSVPVMVIDGDMNTASGHLENIIAISAGEGHSMALDVNGCIYEWGDNSDGELGTGNYNDFNTPVRVLAPDRNGDNLPDDLDGDANTTDYLGDDSPIVSISAGYWHCLAIDSLGRIYSWGWGQVGTLGLGDSDNRTIPVWIPMMDESDDCSSIDIYPDPSYGDGIVNFRDFAVFAEAWLTSIGNGKYDDNVDFVDDDRININDLKEFCDCWLYATGWYLDNYQQGYSGKGESMMSMETEAEFLPESLAMEESQEEQQPEQQSMMPDYNLPAIYLTCDANTPDPNDEVTIWVHSDVPLFCMGLGITVTGDANITDAMSTADCNQFGWDPSWPTDPLIDPTGWVYIGGVIWEADADGVVGYIKFRYNSGQVSVSITEGDAFDANCEPVLISSEALIFGADPNES